MYEILNLLHSWKNKNWLLILLFLFCPYILCFIARMMMPSTHAFLVDILKGFFVIIPVALIEKTEIHRRWYLRFKKLVYEIFDVGKFAMRSVRAGGNADVAAC